MHIPDGYLSPQTYGPLYAIMLFVWQRASVKVKQTINKKNLPLIALSSAFCFVIMMFNVPILGGSTGHAVGSAVIAIALGPWAAAIAISTAVIIQAVIFSDGGITAIGANCFTMAFVMPFSAHYIYHLLAGKYEQFGLKQKISAAVAGYFSLILSALATAIIIGIQPIIAVSASGKPLYAPYPLQVTIPVIAAQNLLFFGFLEAGVTAIVCTYVAKSNVFELTKPKKSFDTGAMDEV